VNINSKSPFELHNIDEYQQWREYKLKNATTKNNKRVLKLKKTPPYFYDISLINEIINECDRDNYCLYSLDNHENYDREQTRQLIHQLAVSCGVSKLDGNICSDKDSLTSICQSRHQDQHEYIPYSNKKLGWHTDGYYNLPENKIHSMLLHCYQAANVGGESAFIDHEIVYILMRDQNPKWIEALSHNDAMTIPENILDNKIIRAEQSGPVFSITSQGRLHMRYTARQKNIIWNNNIATLEGVEFIKSLLNNINDEQAKAADYIIKHTLKAGEGIISRNILHCRSEFTDSQHSPRLLFRGRFYDELPTAEARQ